MSVLTSSPLQPWEIWAKESNIPAVREVEWTEWTDTQYREWIRSLTDDVDASQDSRVEVRATTLEQAAHAIIVCLLLYFSCTPKIYALSDLITAQCGPDTSITVPDSGGACKISPNVFVSNQFTVYM